MKVVGYEKIYHRTVSLAAVSLFLRGPFVLTTLQTPDTRLSLGPVNLPLSISLSLTLSLSLCVCVSLSAPPPSPRATGFSYVLS